MIDNRNGLIEKLTGIQSSRKSYYLDLKAKIAETEKKNTQLQIINQVAKSISVEMTFDEILENVFEKLRQVMSINRLSLSIMEYDRLILCAVSPRGAHTNLRVGQELPKENSLIWRLIHEKKNYYLDNMKEIKYFEQQLLNHLGIKTTLLIPLMVKDQVLGILNLGSSEEIVYDEDEITFIEQLADQLAVGILNARLYSEVLRSKIKWEETFKAVNDLLIFLDLDLNIVRSNKTGISFAGLPPIQVGKKCCEALAILEESCSIDCLALEAINSRSAEYRQLTIPSGKALDIYAYPVLNEENKIYGVMLYIKDVTLKLQMEAQLVQSAKLAAIGEMAAGVAHELNNPLTAILGNAQLLQRNFDPNDPRTQLLDGIHKCGTRCKKIIQNLLTFSRQEPFPFEAIYPNTLIDKALPLVSYQLNLNNIELQTELTPEMPQILGNSQQLEQVLVNLLLNARDAVEDITKNRKIQLATYRYDMDETSPIELSSDKKYIAISVTDNGPGINPSIIPKLFNPFFTTKEVGKGTGLGLSVSLGIAEAHKGTLTVRSKPGETTFQLILPVISTVEARKD